MCRDQVAAVGPITLTIGIKYMDKILFSSRISCPSKLPGLGFLGDFKVV
jgi:hypothetical protein